MRICLFNLTAGFKTGGLETFTWGLADALHNRGHEVEVVAGSGNRVSTSDGIRLIQFAFRPRNEFPDLGTRFRKMAERLSFARHAFSYVRDGLFDVVLINKPYDFPVLWQLKRSAYSGVTCYNSGGTEFYFGDRYLSRAVDLWLPCSKYNAEKIHGHYGSECVVLNNGVDTEKFRPNGPRRNLHAEFSIPGSAPLLISVGRLIGWKGCQVVIEVLTRLPDVHYAMAGGGPERERLEKLALEMKVLDRIHFLGEVPHENLPSLLRGADIFVQPSIGEEAFGISVAEAMACEMPVLASNAWGLREVVVDQETGILVEPGNIDAWAKAIRCLVEDRSLAIAMGAAGRRRAVNRFTWARAAEDLEANVVRILSHRKSVV